jgi:uncharacterized protein YjgD (DUF1641 family)
VKQNKTGGNLSKGQAKNTFKNWKDKAHERSKENTRLRKRLKEVCHSRDLWKHKYQNSSILSKERSFFDGEKAKYHQYSLLLVGLLLDFQRYGTLSLRGCRHCLGCLLISMGLNGRVPSHNSIRNWSCKHGYNRVIELQKQGGEYIVFVDESIVFGSEKILLILGISKDNIPLDRAVLHTDMDVLSVGYSHEWKAESIADELQKIAKYKHISYVVSDEGLNLRKAYNSCNYVHIEDCTHIFANYLKRLYGEDPTFELFRKLIGKLRQAWNLSKVNSQYMPPSMRGKMRFANIFPCIDWSKKCLEKWDTFDAKIQESLQFLQEQKAFIEQLVDIGKIFKLVCENLKIKGFGDGQKQEILEKLSDFETGENTLIFVSNIKDYLENLSQKSTQLGQKHLLCSSDIIESFFGKFKQKINPNSRSGLTEFIFTMANFSGNFTKSEIKNALENITIKDLKITQNRAKTP